uniref:Uncharacterized protein n=1 Tax=Romanomermis culicivorax TaxID=13658 RepID=A0A915ICQ7_ROMCU
MPKMLPTLASNPSDRLERRAKGPGANLLTASSGRPVRGSSNFDLLKSGLACKILTLGTNRPVKKKCKKPCRVPDIKVQQQVDSVRWLYTHAVYTLYNLQPQRRFLIKKKTSTAKKQHVNKLTVEFSEMLTAGPIQ